MTEGADERNNAELVRRYFGVVWNRGDLDAVDDFFGDEFTNSGHSAEDAPALIRAIVAAWWTAFPDLHFDPKSKRSCPRRRRRSSRTCTGTHTGTFEHPTVGVLEPTGRSFAVDYIHIT